MNRTILRFARLIHKWAGLFLAIQVLFWIAGGLIMSSLPLDKVHGDHLVKRNLEKSLTNSDYHYSLDTLVASITAPISQIAYKFILDKEIYIITSQGQEFAYDAQSGELLQDFNKTFIARVAKAHYLGSGEISNVELLRVIPREVSIKSPTVWQVKFDDTWSTTLYISSQSAQFITVRSDIWRIFDFFWMLHIMDYDEREDINNPLLIAFSASALVFTLSGIMLLFQSFRVKRKFKHKERRNFSL